MATRSELSRRRLLQTALVSASAAAAASGLSEWTTQAEAREKKLIRAPGSRPDPKKPEGAESLPEIEHIVIYMNENHSFDSYYGMLGRGDGFKMGRGGKPANAIPGLDGKPVRVFHQPDPCTPITGDHSWNGEHIAWNHGKMDGFLRANKGTGNLGYYDATEIPFYYSLARVFPLCDRWFSSILAPTHPNRRYLQAGTSAGMIVTTAAQILKYPTAPNGTIWDRLDAHGITWKDYMVGGLGDIDLWPETHTFFAFQRKTKANTSTSPTGFLADCRAGTLPQVSIIAVGVQTQYDEGSRDVQNGEAYSYSLINAVMDSPVWDKTVMFFTYDESGGCYDHVPPPPAVAPDNIPPRFTGTHTQPGTFAQYGIRVPAFVISPFAKKNYVSHVVHDHTSILKFIETKWNLGAMTYRDANADNLLDALDFAKPAFREPLRFAKPGLPSGGSTCEPQPRPSVNPIPATAASVTSRGTR